MKHFDPIKDKLREANELPDDLSWDNMKDGIYEKMDPPALLNQESKARKKYLLLLLLLLVFGGGVIYNYYSNAEQQQLVNDTQSKTELKDNTLTKIESFNNTKDQNEMSDNSISKVENNTIEKNTTTKKTPTSKATTLSSNEAEYYVKNNSNRTISAITTIDKKSNYNQSESALNNTSELSNATIIANSQSNFVNKTATNNDEKSIAEKRITNNEDRSITTSLLLRDKLIGIERLNAEVFVEAKPREIFPLQQVFSCGASQGKSSKRLYWSANIGAGFNFFNSNYAASSQATALNNIEQFEIGYSSSFRINTSLKNWYLSSGLNWKSSYRQTEANLVNQFEETKLVVVEIINNPFSGEQLIHDNRSVNIIDSTSFKYDNRFTSYSIPLIIGYQNHIGRMYYKLGIGTDLFFAQSQEGVTVRNNRHIEFGDNNELFKSGFGLAMNSELEISFYVVSRIKIGLRLGFNQYMSDLSAQQDITMKPQTYNSEIILGYSF